MKKNALLVVLAGCVAHLSDEGIQRVEVSEPNKLGVESLVIDRYEDNGSVYRVRAFDGADNEIGGLTIRKGMVDGIAKVPTFGTEMNVNVGTVRERGMTREVNLIRPHFENRTINDFLSIAAVATALKKERLTVDVTPTKRADAAYDNGWQAYGCWSDLINASPVATGCCAEVRVPGDYDPGTIWTKFVNPAGQLSLRYTYNADYGWPDMRCKGQDEWGSIANCSGKNCVWGPLGFARAWLLDPDLEWGPGWSIQPYYDELNGNVCGTSYDYDPPAFAWPDAVGYTPAGGGCCPDGSGPCDTGWSQACTSCGAGGDAGWGDWDM